MTQIIFNSFEEFEDAVMEVLRDRLQIRLENDNQSSIAIELSCKVNGQIVFRRAGGNYREPLISEMNWKPRVCSYDPSYAVHGKVL